MQNCHTASGHASPRGLIPSRWRCGWLFLLLEGCETRCLCRAPRCWTRDGAQPSQRVSRVNPGTPRQQDKLIHRAWRVGCSSLCFSGSEILVADPSVSDSEHPRGATAPAEAKQTVKCPDLLGWSGAGGEGSHIALFTLAAHDILPTSLTDGSISARGMSSFASMKKAAAALTNPLCDRPDMSNSPLIEGKCTRSIPGTRAFAFQIS